MKIVFEESKTSTIFCNCSGHLGKPTDLFFEYKVEYLSESSAIDLALWGGRFLTARG